jgi:hypothetical protein
VTLPSTPAVAESSDRVLVGSGIMSASLGALFKRLEPRLSMIPTYGEDLKVPANAGLFERNSRRSDETLGLFPCAEHAQKAYS